MRARVLGLLLLAAVVGVGGGLGIGYLGQPRAATGGTATPLPASSPSVPVDPPTTEPPFAEDISYPTLGVGLDFRMLRLSNSQATWRVPVPRGWVASDVDTGLEVPRAQWASYDELRFRPKDEPAEGGYSLRVKMINSRQSPAAMVAAKKVDLRDFDIVDWLGPRTDDTLKFSYRTASDRQRFNYFRWLAVPTSSEVTLEMSVAGRMQDVPGLDALFTSFATGARPVT